MNKKKARSNLSDDALKIQNESDRTRIKKARNKKCLTWNCEAFKYNYKRNYSEKSQVLIGEM